MRTRKLANWLRAYSEFTSNSEAPDVFNFWTGVSTIAGALRRRVWIDEVKFKWYPNFYIIFVAPPGIVTKSTTIGVGMSLLRDVPGVEMGPGSMTWQGLTHGLAEATKLVPMSVDSTGMASDYIPMSAVTCEVSELGTFLDPGDTMLTSVLIDLWDGKDVPFERWLKTTENTKIENPWINIIAATTPSWLKDNFSESMIGGGLTSRVVFVYADQKKRLIPYISQVTNADAHEDLKNCLMHDLTRISELKGNFTLTKEAIDFGSVWYEQNWTKPDDHLLGERFQGYRARKQTHIHKLAIILSAAESDDRIITKSHLELALMFVAGVEHDMHKVFESIGISITSKHVHELLTFLKTYRRLKKQDMWRHCMKFMSPKEFGEAIDAAVSAGYLAIHATVDGPVFVYTRDDSKKYSTPEALADSEQQTGTEG